MANFPWTLLMTTMWPLRRQTMEGRRAVNRGERTTRIEKSLTNLTHCVGPHKPSFLGNLKMFIKLQLS